jgi:hypothetical protein
MRSRRGPWPPGESTLAAGERTYSLGENLLAGNLGRLERSLT